MCSALTRAAVSLIVALAACAPSTDREDDLDGAPSVDARTQTVDAGAVADAGFEPLPGVYDETLTLVTDSCGTSWTSPRMFATVVQITATNITFMNSGGTATYTRGAPTTFQASIGSSVNSGMWTSTMSYQITAIYSYTDTGRACTAEFRTLGIRRP